MGKRQAAARGVAGAAIHQIRERPLLERQFAPARSGEGLGDLHLLLLPPQWQRKLDADLQVVVVTRRTAK